MSAIKTAKDLARMVDALATLRTAEHGQGDFGAARGYLEQIETEMDVADEIESAFDRGGAVDAAWMLSGKMKHLTARLIEQIGDE